MDDFNKIEIVFNLCISVNDEILGKEKEGTLNFLDHYVFQATSYVLSIIHDKITVDRISYSRLFMYRCLIECIAIISMYKEGDIPAESEELLNEFNYIAEFNMYKKYREKLDGKQFYFEQIKSNFEDTKKKYRLSMADKGSNEFNKIIKSKLPFLFNEYSFDDIIKAYCEPLYSFYRLISVVLHPSDMYLTYPTIQSEKFDALENSLFILVMAILHDHYSEGKITKELKEEVTLIANSPINNVYLNYATKQKEILYKIADIIKEKCGECTEYYTYIEFGNYIESLAIDKTFGFSEIVKCKYKPYIELIAISYYIVTLPHFEDKRYFVELFTKHTRIKLMDIYGLDTSEKLNEAYEQYKSNVKNIHFDEFKKVFMTSLGFIPEQTSITKLVNDAIDGLIKNDETMNAHLKMLYDEAQMLSHANGYMISSNTGAFMEYSTVIAYCDQFVTLLLKFYQVSWDLYNKTEGKKHYSKFVYDLKKNIKDFEKAAFAKNKLDFDMKDYKMVYK